ncbi:uncharacterized protein PFL1_01475 [Pseudozyma flocculosa PF-1]|uniref:Uncharacterized protein n=1 Tax=Pseudozyma flocculosa TaxID=84751 RepID=A0A5C3FE49_9BASI|nr:uncharacterized protein PFL1_01475 [Pseudozyma flocculosa PF-1]EPQ31290.1 hypothetical protein PFL1_01475 [Pseudozyma flocculosa PF-1]SPO41751.1 uncharacterized protein PSFLO_07233 [Pseudozyma flocculosa]
MLYSSLVAASFLLLVSFVLYRQRGFLVSLLPVHLQDRVPPFLQPSPNDAHGGMLGGFFSSSPSSTARYSRLGNFDWGNSIRAGLNSSLFDIEANVRDGDQRSGLDERGAMDIQAIMQQYGVSFDEARLIRHKQILANNNIDPLTGLPLDSKAVTSLGGTVGRGGAAGSSRLP